MTTFADIRRKHGPSQQAFARRCELTQPQVSNYERGLAQVTDDVITRIAEKCGETIPTIRAALELSRTLPKDPVIQGVRALERLLKDLYVRTDEAGRLNLAVTTAAFGRTCFQFLTEFPSAPVNWHQLASVAREERMRLEGEKRTSDWATSRGALIAAEGMTASVDSGRLLAHAWLDKVDRINDVLSSANDEDTDAYIHDLGWTMLPAALSDYGQYLAAANRLGDAWADYSFEFAERRTALPLAHQQLAGVVSLSSGVADAVLRTSPAHEPAVFAAR